MSPWTFEIHPLDRPGEPEAHKVRRLLKALGRQYGLRVRFPAVDAAPVMNHSDIDTVSQEMPQDASDAVADAFVGSDVKERPSVAGIEEWI